MIIDDQHTAFARTVPVKRAAKEFIDKHLGSNDLMAVVHTAGGPKVGQELTTNKRLLLASVDRTFGIKADSAAISKARGDVANVSNDQERAHNARMALETVRQVAGWFDGIHGRRKTILFVSEGVDYNIGDPSTIRMRQR